MILFAADLSSLASSFSADAVNSIFQVKTLLHFIYGGHSLLATPDTFENLFGQVNVFEIIEMLHDGLADVVGFASARSFSQNVKPLANAFRNANPDHLVCFFFFHIPSRYMLYNCNTCYTKTRDRQNQSPEASYPILYLPSPQPHAAEHHEQVYRADDYEGGFGTHAVEQAASGDEKNAGAQCGVFECAPPLRLRRPLAQSKKSTIPLSVVKKIKYHCMFTPLHSFINPVGKTRRLP
jgi:hypothetical protein